MKTKADMLKALAESYDLGSALLNEQTDASINETVDAAFLGPSTRARVFWFLLGHSIAVVTEIVQGWPDGDPPALYSRSSLRFSACKTGASRSGNHSIT